MATQEKTLSFKCPNPRCGSVYSQPLSWLKNNKNFTCPWCNSEVTTIDFDKLPELKATEERKAG